MMSDRTTTSLLSGVWGRINLPGLSVIVLCVVLWDVYSRTLGSQFETIASTSQIFDAFRSLLIDGPLIPQLIHTITVSVTGWIIACTLGFAMGLVVGIWGPAWTYTMASIDVLRSIPSISFVSIALLIFGFSSSAEMVIVVYVSQWPVLLATSGGVRAVQHSLLEVARTFRLSQAATTFKVILPGALPSILVGLRLALTLSIALAVVAEMVGNPAGLGFGIVFSQQAMQPGQAFAYLVVIGLLGWGMNSIFVLATSRMFRRYGRLL
jgi:sulfonate transport system permease protein